MSRNRIIKEMLSKDEQFSVRLSRLQTLLVSPRIFLIHYFPLALPSRSRATLAIRPNYPPKLKTFGAPAVALPPNKKYLIHPRCREILQNVERYFLSNVVTI